MILVTGGTGFVGSHLILHLLKTEEQICATYRNAKSQSFTLQLFKHYNQEQLFYKIKWIECDITDITALDNAFIGVSEVYHCAAIISFNPREERLIRKINIEGTANIVNQCLAHNVGKLCYFSSIAAIAEFSRKSRIVTEETDWDPEKFHSDYAISKHGAEMEVWRGKQEGLNVIILNPGIIIGVMPERKTSYGSNEFFNVIRKGLPFYTSGTAGFVSVTDVVEIAVELMQKNIFNQRYILVAENISIRGFLNIVADKLNKKRPSIKLNSNFIKCISKLDWLFSNFLRTKRRLPKSIARASYSQNIYSNEKIRAVSTKTFTDIKRCVSEI